MIFKRTLILAQALLTNGLVMPDDEEERLVLLEYALQEVANKATTLRLVSLNVDNRIVKPSGVEGVFMRSPALPRNVEEEIDIDEPLAFAVARYLAAFVSEDPKIAEYHVNKAIDIINQYNTTVESYLEGLDNDTSTARIPQSY